MKFHLRMHRDIVTFQIMHFPTITDDVAVSNVDFKCTNNEHLPHWNVATVSTWGTYDAWRNCGTNQAVCGIQTKIEGTTATDESALNKLKLFCCDIL